MRGKLRYNLAKVIQIRITPAGAGKTVFTPAATSACRDHPRRCGENTTRLLWGLTLLGSPPQVRGKRDGVTVSKSYPGITPAGAGKTWIYPRRTCGSGGSPPQVRGKPRTCAIFSISARITPAGAGKTDRHWETTRQQPDHPRRCGENYLKL